MKIMHTIPNEADAARPKRRFYSPELKTQVVQECRQIGSTLVQWLKRLVESVEKY